MVEIEGKGEQLATVLEYYDLEEYNNKIICPFHDDINPSMIVDFENGTFYCFGCLASGDAMKFVKLAESHLDDLWAVKKFYRILRKNKKNGKIKYKKQLIGKRGRGDLQQLYDEAHDFYFGLKTIDWGREKSEVKDYMYKRGFEPKSLNLCKAKLTYNDNYPIVFPMFDLGKFKGWVSRTTTPEIEAKRKYLYNTGFSRRDTLVGDYNNSKVVLVEGYMDWLKMKQFGVKYVAAILGWKITKEQIEKLQKQGVKTIISALDADECGKKGTKELAKYFNVIPFQFLKGVKDPGEMNYKQFKKSKIKTMKMEVVNDGSEEKRKKSSRTNETRGEKVRK